MEKKLKSFVRLYPWYVGFSGDLLFWVAVDTLFLQLVKGLELSDIVFATSLSYAFNIILQFPILKLVERLGNTGSCRVGVLVALASSLSLTLGRSFAVLAGGMVLREISFSFKSMHNVMLKNNLELLGRESEYIKYSTRGNMVYSVATMLISLVASMLFNLSGYLPMALCVFFCLLSCVLSLWMVDCSANAKVQANGDKSKKQGFRLDFSRLVLVTLLTYGLFFAIVETGQVNGKLFIQDELLGIMSEDNTALIVGAIILVSRCARILGNAVFYRMYAKLGERVGVLFSTLLCMSFVLMLLGFLLGFSPILKFTVMGIGYLLILFVRDPDRLYTYNLMLKVVEKEKQQRVLMLLELSRKLLSLMVSLAFSSLLLTNPMSLVIAIYIALGTIEIALGAYLYKLIGKDKVIF